jgi:hypothetical protein
MERVLINNQYGGFGVSEAAAYRLRELGVTVAVDVDVDPFDGSRVARVGRVPCARHDARLLQVFDEMGEAMAGQSCGLAVVDVDGPRYRVTEYDGWEAVQTPWDIEWVYIA